MTSRYFAAFLLRRSSSPGQPPQIGFTLPRAVGKAAVRNRIRRRMREAVRPELPRLGENWTIVFNPRRAVINATFEDLCRETARVIDRCSEQS